MTTNILNLLSNLHIAGVRVSLLDEYNPANILTKDTDNPVEFKQTEKYYVLPEYTISSAANLNVKFCLKGVVIDHAHNTEHEAVTFRTVTFVKNGKLFKDKLHICPDDVQKVVDLGFTVNNNVIDLTTFDLEDGIDVDQYQFARACVEQYIYDSFREKQTRAAKIVTDLPEETKFLLQNGYNPETKVWNPIIINSEVRVKNTKTDFLRAIINNLKTTPRLDDIKIRLADNKSLNAAQKALYDLSKTDYQIADHSFEINTAKYKLVTLGLQNAIRIAETVMVNGIRFDVVIE